MNDFHNFVLLVFHAVKVNGDCGCIMPEICFLSTDKVKQVRNVS